jgi:hypothetical protein
VIVPDRIWTDDELDMLERQAALVENWLSWGSAIHYLRTRVRQLEHELSHLRNPRLHAIRSLDILPEGDTDAPTN